MALNKFMHPRNIYKKPPDFKKLACSNPDFRKHIIQELSGRVTIDFKNAEALRSLTTSLLKQDFGLDVQLPLDRLIPTIPLRLNYILWMEDILHVSHRKSDVAIRGIDIGTGASCVYPLIGCKLNNWYFLATELDAENLAYARKNVDNNGLSHMIDVECATEDTILADVLARSPHTYDFCLCNPPFFADNFEAQGLNSRSDERPEPRSSSTASPAEQMVCGGEVEFVKRMIEESQTLKDKIRIFTSMLGKKSSLVPLKNELRRLQVPCFSSTEFCQGKTMRWGIGWSYDDTVIFPKSAFQTKKKNKPPLVFPIPTGTSVVEYSVTGVGDFIKGHLDKLKITYEEMKSTSEVLSLSLCAKENTWSKLRRKKRQMKRDRASLPISGAVTDQSKGGDNCLKGDNSNARLEDVVSRASNEDPTESAKQDSQDDDSQNAESKKRKAEEEFEVNDVKRPRTDQTICSEVAQGDNAVRSNELDVDPSCSSANSSEFLFQCTISVRCSSDDQITIEMVWNDGINRESMHQVLQYLKNQFTA